MCYFILLTYSVVVHCKLCAKEQPMQCSDFLDIGSYQLLSLSHNVVVADFVYRIFAKLLFHV